MIRKLALSVLALLALLAAGRPADAQTCSAYPFTFTPNTTIRSAQVNSNFTSILNCANNSLAPIASPSFTGTVSMATPLAPGQGGTPVYYGGTATGTANAQVVASTTPANFALASGNIICWASEGNNSGSTTLNANGTGVTTIQKLSGTSLVNLTGGELAANVRACAQYDGSVYEFLGPNGATGTVTSAGIADATNGGLNVSGSPITGSGNITLNLLPSDLLTKSTPTTSDSVVIEDNAASNAAKTATLTNLFATSGSGTLKAGTANTLNPYALSTNQTQAHGLGAAPTIVSCYLQNLTTELGYSPGERISVPNNQAPQTTNGGITLAYDGTNTYLITDASHTFSVQSTSGSPTYITAANWELVCTPYLIR